MPFYIYAWITDVCYGLSSVTGKLASKHQIKNVWQLNFVWGWLICIFTVPFAVGGGVGWPTHWGPLWVYGITSMLSGTLWLLSLYRMDISAVAPLYSLRIVFSLFMGVILFKEHLNNLQYICVAVIFLSGLFVNLDEQFSLSSFFNASVAITLIAVFCSAALGVATKYAMAYEGFWEVTMWGSILSMIPLFVTIPLFWKDMKQTRIRTYSGMFITVIISFIGFLCANRAFAVNVSITSAILSIPTSMIFAFLFSVFAPTLLEKHSLKVYAVRFVAAGLMVCAAILLTV